MPTTRKPKAGEKRPQPQTGKETTTKGKQATAGLARKTASPVAKRATGKKAGTRGTRRNENAAVKELTVQTVHDYQQVKKALGRLWEDVAKTTYSAFNTIAANVEKRFEQSRQAISEIDVRYALEKTGAKLKSLKNNASNTAQQLGRQVKLLYQMLKDTTTGKFKAPWATVSAITAALLYFISPIDVLPDFIPAIGLIDDALVLSLCLSVIRMDLRRYAKENELDLAEYGLAKAK